MGGDTARTHTLGKVAAVRGRGRRPGGAPQEFAWREGEGAGEARLQKGTRCPGARRAAVSPDLRPGGHRQPPAGR